jgi:galactokinase
METQASKYNADSGRDWSGPAVSRTLESMYGSDRVAVARERYGRLAVDLSGELRSAGTQSGTEASFFRFYSAPGRTELGGNHTDHNRGRVLCAAVTLDAVAAVSLRNDTIVRIVSKGYARPVMFDLRSLEARQEESGTTQALARGVARGLSDRLISGGKTGLRGFDAVIQSDVLQGSGLSSSAAIEVLFGCILADIAERRVDPVDIAKIGQYAENVYFGKPCGLMDQTASAVGGIAYIDFADPSNPVVEKIAYDFERDGYTLVVVDTGGSHADLTAEYAAIPAEMRAAASVFGASFLREVDPEHILASASAIRASAGDRALLRSLHFVKENARVPLMAAALRHARMDEYLDLVRASGDSSWRFLQNLGAPHSPREQGPCVALALSESLGSDPAGRSVVSRVHGGGFAGTIQAYVPSDLLPDYTRLLESCFGAGKVIPVRVRIPGAIRVL